jgi:predicted helicase
MVIDTPVLIAILLKEPEALRFMRAIVDNEKRCMIAFVSNNSFLENIAFDGMRSYLEKEFSKIYVLDLGGNVRKNPKLSGTTHNVFGIQVGVSITMLVKKAKS